MELLGLNEPQRLGVTTTEGPVLILAGAGSGKTRVLTHRVAYLIEDCGVNPYNILAITFTNKAASEMRERVDKLVGFGAEAVWVSTFHSLCVRILRRYAERLGYTSSFTIYDTDDTKKLMKEVTKKLALDPKRYKDRTFLNEISSNKNELIGPEDFATRHDGDFTKEVSISVYREYQARLKAANAMDFDDLLVNTVELLRYNPDVLEYYQNRFMYIMVDEYQDTNTAQFQIIKLLASANKNLCVVGDDDQSIYKFRGANIHNILDFEKQYPDACVIKLEENYRSTKNILNAANSVIRNNVGRKDKTLFTSNEEGDKIKFHRVDTAYEEAGVIASDIGKRVRMGQCRLSDCAILYRTNAQSRILEEKLINEGIAYKIVGGVNFYARREIKDILAYLKLVANDSDEIALRRIINVPKRGIGDTSIAHVSGYAISHDISLYEAMASVEGTATASRAASKIEKFINLIEELREMAKDSLVTELAKKIIDETDYVTELKVENTDEAKARIENIEELISKMYIYEEECNDLDKKPSLDEFLEEVSLVADIDSLDQDADYVVLMTLHSAKGLEFPYVYMAGMEESLFPSDRCFGSDDDDELEEERRLCYVGITRAIKHLTMTSAASRMTRGETSYNAISRFVKEIDESLLDGSTWEPKRSSYYSDYEDSSGVSDFFKPSAYKKTKSVAFTARDFGTKIEKKSLDYIVGDRVLHQKFGAGTVQLINDGGRDFEVTVEFDTVGRKKMFASFAKLEKI